MANTVFFSWQADRPTKEGRNLVERALERAIGQVGEDTTVEEAVRELEVDRDTKGVPGSPPIVETIFRKIDQAAIFVPDLTFVGTRPDGRPTPNPNVLIEYGWALKSLTYSRIVPVMNVAFGQPTPDAMPFDMRHLRNPIQYNCPPNASEDVRKQARLDLAKLLESALRDVLRSDEFRQKNSEADASSLFVSRASQDGQGRFRLPGEPLGVADHRFSDAREIKLTDGPVVWFRLMPTRSPKRTWQFGKLKTAATTNESFLYPISTGWSGFNFIRAEDGFGVCAAIGQDEGTTSAAVFAFSSGEVWSIDSYLLEATRRNGRGTIPPVEQDFQRALAGYSKFLVRLGIQPPFRWQAGMEDLKGRGLFDNTGRLGGFRGPSGYCVSNVIVEEGTFGPNDPPEKSIEPFFVKLFDSCGLERSHA